MKRMSALILAGVVAACGGSDGGEERVATTSVDQTAQSGVQTPLLSRTKSAAEWQDLWARHTATLAPAPALPAVDFTREEVLGVFVGMRPNACYSVEITKVVQTDTARVVIYRERTPGPTVLCASVLVYPAHLVRVPAGASPVEFRKE